MSAQCSEDRRHLLARCRHADAAAEAAEAFKLGGSFCFPDKLTITRTAVDCKKKSRALKESQLFSKSLLQIVTYVKHLSHR